MHLRHQAHGMIVPTLWMTYQNKHLLSEYELRLSPNPKMFTDQLSLAAVLGLIAGLPSSCSLLL